MYLSFLIFDEERKRNKFRNDEKTIKMDFLKINDEDKI